VAEQLADDELAHLERVHNRLYSFTEGREIYNQKFAELIVRECIDIADEYDGVGSTIVGRIQKHFGVEE
jgi:hypothetical protein